MKTAPARRMTSEIRRQQLIDVASTTFAKDGYNRCSLEEIADIAGVTRNLLYRYFPRGRPDLFIAVINHAVSALNADYIYDPDVDVRQRHEHNLTLIANRAMSASEPWLIYIEANGVTDPEIAAFLETLQDQWATRTALNNDLTPTRYVVAALAAHQVGSIHLLELARRRDLGSAWTIATLIAMQDATTNALRAFQAV